MSRAFLMITLVPFANLIQIILLFLEMLKNIQKLFLPNQKYFEG